MTGSLPDYQNTLHPFVPPPRLRICILVSSICLALAPASFAAEEVDYARDIKPILIQHCVQCHGPVKQENGLRLDTGAAAVRGGDTGAAVVPGKVEESLLLRVVRGKSDSVSKMPPKGPSLTDEQISSLERWVAGGAKSPADEQPQDDPRRSHWSFQKIVSAPPPAVKNSAWANSPIDLYILAKQEEHSLAPSEAASRPTLLRRISLDLIGLLPTPADIAEFAADPRPDAYERQVDRLLASPHYGERWGRHWLDLARYADSNGYTRDFGRQIWKYREWVIDAVNANLPFDQFTIEQMAGDLLPGAAVDSLVATGFHRNTLINEEGGTDPEQFRVEAVADRVQTTAAIYLGLTLGCARCHSHKYDPISQVEYYQVFALLNNCDEPTIEVPTKQQLRQGDLARREVIREQIKNLEMELEKQRPAFDQAQRAWEKTVTPQQRARLPGPVQLAYDMPVEKRDAANKKLVEDFYRSTAEARQAFPVVDQIFKLQEAEPKIPTTMILRERAAPRETHVHKRGDFLDHGVQVSGNTPAALPPLAQPTRLEFARWLVAPENPLSARVVMNRDWQKFFGRGIVETEDDFGLQGSRPTHPQLLDWLASEFMRGGWDVKRMHRRLATSAVYRQSSRARSDLLEKDPGNHWLARQGRLRLDAEIVRDAALSASGLLTETLGGPSVFPPQPDGVFDFTQDPKPWSAATGANRCRRGMYTHFWRSAPYPALMVFDAPSGNVTCTRRVRSNTPLQALTMANDTAFVECAQALARQVQAAAPGDADRLHDAFHRCLSREPTPGELERLSAFLARERSATSELAAWMAVCRVVLNLDEMITRE